MYRDLTMKEISEQQIGQTLQVAGWVENIRDHGGVSFIDLRDMYGVLQVVIRKPELLKGITKEMCLSITGLMEHRDEETYNPKIPSGTIELEAHKIDVLGRVYKQLPFEIQTSKEIREDVRLKYRYLDLKKCKSKGQHCISFQGDQLSAPEDDGHGIFGDPDPDPVCFFARGRQRLYCSQQKI